MCILLERKGYRLDDIRRLHRAYVRDVLLHADADEDAKTGQPVFLTRKVAKPLDTTTDPRRDALRRRGVPEHLIDSELRRIDAENAALRKAAGLSQ